MNRLAAKVSYAQNESNRKRVPHIMNGLIRMNPEDLETEQDFADAIRAHLIPVCMIIDAARTKGFHPAFQLGPNEAGKESVRMLSITKQY